jgi:hypothetical protein
MVIGSDGLVSSGAALMLMIIIAFKRMRVFGGSFTIFNILVAVRRVRDVFSSMVSMLPSWIMIG